MLPLYNILFMFLNTSRFLTIQIRAIWRVPSHNIYITTYFIGGDFCFWFLKKREIKVIPHFSLCFFSIWLKELTSTGIIFYQSCDNFSFCTDIFFTSHKYCKDANRVTLFVHNFIALSCTNKSKQTCIIFFTSFSIFLCFSAFFFIME